MLWTPNASVSATTDVPATIVVTLKPSSAKIITAANDEDDHRHGAPGQGTERPDSLRPPGRRDAGGLHQGLRGSESGPRSLSDCAAYGPVDQTFGDQPGQHGRDDQEDDPQWRERHDLGRVVWEPIRHGAPA